MSHLPITISKNEAQLLSQLIENVLFNNSYDIHYNEYLKSLYEIKIKLEEDKPLKIEYK